jgi:DNA (cytosine-5)-methyltransferase 1
MTPRAAEFFAGIGLVRQALEDAAIEVVWANDIEVAKRDLYVANFGEDDFELGDVRDVHADDLPDIDLATASFPCTDLSLAGGRKGLDGDQSGMFWEFARVIGELADDGRAPGVVCLENVPSFATSHAGEDLRAAVERLNELGYACDLLVLDARRFVPQSRPRLFIIGELDADYEHAGWGPDDLRPKWITLFADAHVELDLRARKLRPPLAEAVALADVVQKLRQTDPRWWEPERLERFVGSLSERQAERLEGMKAADRLVWASAYRRTREGIPRWEIRGDGIAGCLRTTRGGSAKQALVEAGRGVVRARWMTPLEYARLQGVRPTYRLGRVTPNQALFGLGDAVCVPAVAWLARERLLPVLREQSERAAPVAQVG